MIAQNDFTRQWKAVERDVLSAVRRVGSSGWYILGKEVEQFEQALAEQSGVTYAVGVGNGMDALEIALRCVGLGEGQKVLTTSLSAFASTLAILRIGGSPVFVDVDGTGNLNLSACREQLGRDRSIRFFLPVHLYGNPVNLKQLADLRDEFNLQLVEDCAQAIGATDKDLCVGTVGQVAATSFYPTKNLGALGDGGAILTNDPSIAARAKTLRNYGQSSLYHHSEPGLNSRLDELHAAILREALLPNLGTWTARRRQIARAYYAGIRHAEIELLPIEADAGSVWHLFPVLVSEGKRDALRDHLRAKEILSGIHYPRIIPDQEALKAFPGYQPATGLERARKFAQCELSLPIHPWLTDREVETVIESCNGWVASVG
ncbi:MAG: DegT/DnrJ/EryC1/StrS family aminotransferase [Chthoniobacterales bacterium]